MHEINVALAIMGLTVLLLGLGSKVLKATPFQLPLLALAVGVLVGPAMLGLFDPGAAGDPRKLLLEVVRVTLAVNLMGVALRLTPHVLSSIWKPAALLTVIAMCGMWALSSITAGLTLGLAAWGALLLGAVVTPTDPVVASAIVTGSFAKSHLPQRLRGTLSLESGSNDGLTYLFVMLPIIMLDIATSHPWRHWLVETLLVHVLLAVLVGAGLGALAGATIRAAKARRLMADFSLLNYTVALSLTVLGIARLIGTDALIAVFTAGIAFNLACDVETEHEEESIQEAVGKLFTLPVFILFGSMLPWEAWLARGWPLLVLVVLILLVRRLPVLLLLRPLLARTFNWPDALFLGWFGPIGVAAIFYALHAHEKTGLEVMWTAGSLVVAASIVVHGLTAAPLTRLYSRFQEDP